MATLTLDLNIGAKVYCNDEACGTLHKVIVDPEADRITDLIVERGFLRKTSRVVPVAAVADTTDDNVHLSISNEELEEYPKYEEVELKKPESGWGSTQAYEPTQQWDFSTAYDVPTKPVVTKARVTFHKGVSPTQAVVERDTPVYNARGEIGKVDHMLADLESREITHLIMRRGLIPEYIVIPAEMIKEVGELSVTVAVSEEALEALPHYTPRDNEEILQELKARLQVDDMDFQKVHIEVDSGIVHLSGAVADLQAKRHAEGLARAIDGVVDVENEIYPDTMVTLRIMGALMDNPQTRLSLISVVNERGHITLKGRVDDPEISLAAAELALEQEGVRSVDNKLRVEYDADTPSLGDWNCTWVYHLKKDQIQ